MDLGAPIVADLEHLLDTDRRSGLAALDAELHAIEDARRVLAAREAHALGLAEQARLHTVDEHASMWGYLRADLGWSTSECRRRMRLARLVAEHRRVGEALAEGAVPVAAAASSPGRTPTRAAVTGWATCSASCWLLRRSWSTTTSVGWSTGG